MSDYLSTIFFACLLFLTCLFSFMCTVHNHLESRYSVCVCTCAITRLAALRTLIQPRYLGGDPYGRRQSDVDGITATLVLMRSSLARMSDRMTVRCGPHGSRPGRQGDRHKHTYTYMHANNTYTLTCAYIHAEMSKV